MVRLQWQGQRQGMWTVRREDNCGKIVQSWDLWFHWSLEILSVLFNRKYPLVNMSGSSQIKLSCGAPHYHYLKMIHNAHTIIYSMKNQKQHSNLMITKEKHHHNIIRRENALGRSSQRRNSTVTRRTVQRLEWEQKDKIWRINRTWTLSQRSQSLGW